MMIAGALTLGAAGVALLTATAPRAAATDKAAVAPMAAFVHDIGGRQVVGYYLAENGACAVTLMLADPAGEDAPPPGAARLRLTLQPAATAALDGVEGGRLAVTCGNAARTLIVDSRPAGGRLASR